MKSVSASKARLLRACRFPFRDSTPWVDERGRSAINGDRFHRSMAVYAVTGKRPLETGRRLKWLEDRLDHAEGWWDARKGDGWRVEVAYAYNPNEGTGRILGYDIDRKYEEHGRLPHEVPGSSDIQSMSRDTVTVYDWKTGRFVTDAVWDQMEWLALLAARATGAWQARAVVLHATDYGIVESERLYDDVALWRIAEQMRIDVNAIDDAWPQVSEDCDGCYCPARAGCELYQLARKGDEHDAA